MQKYHCTQNTPKNYQTTIVPKTPEKTAKNIIAPEAPPNVVEGMKMCHLNRRSTRPNIDLVDLNKDLIHSHALYGRFQ